MYICNMRRKCEKKEACEHAIKHIKTKNCNFPTNCALERRRNCVVYGAPVKRMLKAIEKSSTEIRQPITQEEASKALVTLRNIYIAEKRLGGETKIDKKIDLEPIILGLGMAYTRNLFPDAITRGLSRMQIRMDLLKENERQKQVRRERSNKRYNYIFGKSIETRKGDLHYKRANALRQIMRDNYLLLRPTARRSVSFAVYAKNLGNAFPPTISIHKKWKEYEIMLPIGKVIREVNKKVVVLNYEDSNKTDYNAFVLTGKKHIMVFIESRICDGCIQKDVDYAYKVVMRDLKRAAKAAKAGR